MVLLRVVISWFFAAGAGAQPQPQVAGPTPGPVPPMMVAVEIGGRLWALEGAPASRPAGPWRRRRTNHGGLVVKIGAARPAAGPMTVISRDGACQTRAIRRAVIHFPQYAACRHMGWVPGEQREAIALAGCVPRTDHGSQAALVIATHSPVTVDAADFTTSSWLFTLDQHTFHVALDWSGDEGVPFADTIAVSELRNDALTPLARQQTPITFPSFESPEW